MASTFSFILGIIIAPLIQPPPFPVSSQIAPTHPTSIQVCFTPQNRCLPGLLRSIKEAQKHIYLQGYSFTSEPLAQSLIEAHQRGVTIIAIFDKSQKTAHHSEVKRLVVAGIPVYLDVRPAIAHNKIILIDGHLLFTGSYNWTKAAESRNAENLLRIDDVNLFKLYLDNFQLRKDLSQPWSE